MGCKRPCYRSFIMRKRTITPELAQRLLAEMDEGKPGHIPIMTPERRAKIAQAEAGMAAEEHRKARKLLEGLDIKIPGPGPGQPAGRVPSRQEDHQPDSRTDGPGTDPS
ncbi:hypothetical protein JCM15519_07080 [Fundidesulfovibrio butyratiphilus]